MYKILAIVSIILFILGCSLISRSQMKPRCLDGGVAKIDGGIRDVITAKSVEEYKIRPRAFTASNGRLIRVVGVEGDSTTVQDTDLGRVDINLVHTDSAGVPEDRIPEPDGGWPDGEDVKTAKDHMSIGDSYE
jgi:hypothetical protein